MKDVILLYDDCCIYEIVILNYFLKCTNSEMLLCAVGRKTIRAMEGYSINCDISIDEIECSEIRSFIIPGGDISNIDHKNVLDMLKNYMIKKLSLQEFVQV